MKKGFTLAEVLITLGIIGVVAALTLPTVINNYQNKQKSAILKKTYSTLNQALTMSQQEHGDVSGWERFPYHREGSLEWSNEYIFKYLKTTVACEGGNDELKCPTEVAKICEPSGKDCHSNALYAAIFVLADGQNIYLYGGGNPDKQRATDYIHVLVDTNGVKPPNQYGKDVFVFILHLKSTPPLDAFGYATISRGYLKWQCMQYPDHCSSLLKFDNWEFKNDYPWH